ncbi:branched-chain alpha-ketoacid dehydrogenase [Leucosporidium creatinivorum]|uniref:Protein-serine/threonine kinase n=1 Tax=Leucosporidium creatinivorum TaxID=106004 RepID=A0A1Y2BWW6_9BASI|nr:branched-chain alpha-ketoacid dehydrogenase [Leucosporidium creatinivorum]
MSRATPHLFQQPLRASKVPVFYTNKVIESYAAKGSTPISLKHLINFGKGGRNKGEKEEAEKLLKGGNFLRTELPTRLSHRLRDLQELPYIVASNPRMAHVYDLYLEAFEQIRRFPVIKDLEDNDRFCEFMQGTLDKHRVVIPDLAIGVSESSPFHLPPQDLDTIMVRMLRSRISRRVITEQHIALTSQFRERQRSLDKGKGREVDEQRVGIVDTRLKAAEVVRRCEELIRRRGGAEATVPIRLEGMLEDEFAYIDEHLEFMLFEMIKNATQATVAHHGSEEAKHHPITITIVHGPRDLAVRVSDEGGGLTPYGGLPPPPAPSFPLLAPGSTVADFATAQRLDIFSFSHMRRYYQHHAAQDEAQAAALASSSPSSPAGALESPDSAPATGAEGAAPKPLTGIMALRTVGKLAGTVKEQLAVERAREGQVLTEEDEVLRDAQMKSGIGLPLARMFAEYFSGTLEIFTVQGHGSDALLKIPKFGIESWASTERR